jgi:hypothetical protein
MRLDGYVARIGRYGCEILILKLEGKDHMRVQGVNGRKHELKI